MKLRFALVLLLATTGVAQTLPNPVPVVNTYSIAGLNAGIAYALSMDSSGNLFTGTGASALPAAAAIVNTMGVAGQYAGTWYPLQLDANGALLVDGATTSTGTGGTTGIPAGYQCTILHAATTAPNYFATAACVSSSSGAIVMYTSAAHPLGSESYSSVGSMTTGGWTSASVVTGTNIKSGESTVAFSATPTFVTTAQSNIVTLTGNVTSSTLAAGSAGQGLTLTACQDATGLHTFTWPTNVHGAGTVAVTASTCSSQHFTYSVVKAGWYADSTMVAGE